MKETVLDVLATLVLLIAIGFLLNVAFESKTRMIEDFFHIYIVQLLATEDV